MRCTRCNAENPQDKKFCGDCGTELVTQERVAVPDQPGAYYCHKHAKEATRVTCGRCERPICTRCAVPGPVGVRCRDCARNRVPIRPRGVLHAAGKHAGENPYRTAWYLVAVYAVVSFFTNLFGGGGSDA